MVAAISWGQTLSTLPAGMQPISILKTGTLAEHNQLRAQERLATTAQVDHVLGNMVIDNKADGIISYGHLNF
eukprot:3632002-Ditylum_brightwellii.AAC.1